MATNMLAAARKAKAAATQERHTWARRANATSTHFAAVGGWQFFTTLSLASLANAEAFRSALVLSPCKGLFGGSPSSRLRQASPI